MRSRAHPDAGDVRGAADDLGKIDAALIAQTPTTRQVPPPLERHDPIADDKVALFPVPRIVLLAGTWQGPGSIAELRRWRP